MKAKLLTLSAMALGLLSLNVVAAPTPDPTGDTTGDTVVDVSTGIDCEVDIDPTCNILVYPDQNPFPKIISLDGARPEIENIKEFNQDQLFNGFSGDVTKALCADGDLIDIDGDGWANLKAILADKDNPIFDEGNKVKIANCENIIKFAEQNLIQYDCNDEDPSVNPSATESCDDQIDNNCDGRVNEGCPAPSEICDDDVDNNGDGRVDEDCDTTPPPAVEICGDSVDNDGDGDIDEGCTITPPPAVEICDDSIDNDGDGLVDADDSDCEVTPDANTSSDGGCSLNPAYGFSLMHLLMLLPFALVTGLRFRKRN